jgi:CheY-like chemotaxis protein
MALTVLVVEDQENLRNEVRAVLERSGYLVNDAAGGAEALTILGRIEDLPCLVLWDTLSPTHDIAHVDQAIRAGVKVAALPVTVGAGSIGSTTTETTKRLASAELVLRLVEEHCPKAETG